MSIQHDRTMELAARLGDKAFGLLVSWKGHTLTVTHFGSEAERWTVHGYADVAGDDPETGYCEAEGATAEEAMDRCAEKIEKIEYPNGRPRIDPDALDEDPESW